MYRSKSGKYLYQFYKEREDIFRQHLDRLKLRLDEEDIHNLRRAGKRLKALCQLFEQINPSYNYVKRFSPIKEIFNNAGLLREVQVNKRTLIAYKVSPGVIKNFDSFVLNKKKIFRKQFQESIENFNNNKQEKTIKKTKKLCEQIEHKAIVDASLSYIYENLEKIKFFVTNGNTEDNVHSVRIYLKKISPVINMLSIIKMPDFDKDFSIIKLVEDKIGYWHDRVVLLHSLYQMKKIYPVPDEIKNDLDFLTSVLATENSSFIQNMDKLINPCINELEKV